MSGMGYVWRVRRSAVLTVVLLALLGASAAAAPVLNGTFPVSDTPYKLTQGSDGNVWVVVGGTKVARITPEGAVTEFDLTGVTGAKGITNGLDGNLWVTATGKVVKHELPGRSTPAS